MNARIRSAAIGLVLGLLATAPLSLGTTPALGRVRKDWPTWAPQVPAYGIGALAAFWLVERVVGIWKLGS